jgi:hypothetical protein
VPADPRDDFVASRTRCHQQNNRVREPMAMVASIMMSQALIPSQSRRPLRRGAASIARLFECLSEGQLVALRVEDSEFTESPSLADGFPFDVGAASNEL